LGGESTIIEAGSRKKEGTLQKLFEAKDGSKRMAFSDK
jgi:hypothetical protein